MNICIKRGKKKKKKTSSPAGYFYNGRKASRDATQTEHSLPILHQKKKKLADKCWSLYHTSPALERKKKKEGRKEGKKARRQEGKSS